MRPPRSLAALAGLLACACSSGANTSTSHNGGGTATPVAAAPYTFPPDRAPGYTRLDMSRPITSVTLCGDTRSGTYQVRDVIARSRGAVLATATSLGTPRWNTADGTRPTQAYVDQLVDHPTKVNGWWPPQPGIYTPTNFSVQRVLHGSGLPQPLLAFLHAGSVGQDTPQVCAPTITPGRSYLVLLGPELTSNAAGGTPIVQPVIEDALLYDPGLGAVYTPSGPQTP